MRLFPYMYPIRYNRRTNLMFPSFQEQSPRNVERRDGGFPAGYAPEGFVQVQNAIANTFYKMKSNKEMPLIWLQVLNQYIVPYNSYVTTQ